jgi:putative MATE family efflux protein
VATGMTSCLSRLLGEKRTGEAGNVALHGVVVSCAVAVGSLLLLVLAKERLFLWFGADEKTLPECLAYMEIMQYALLLVFPLFLIYYIFIAQGSPLIPAMIQIVSLAIQLVLEPILIFTLDMGIRGAAATTAITSALMLTVALVALCRKSKFDIPLKGFTISRKVLWEILRIGTPATLTMLLVGFFMVCVNRLMAEYSMAHVAAVGIVSKLETFAILPLMATSNGLLPLVGILFGARHFRKLRSMARTGITVSALIGLLMAIAFFSFPRTFVGVFSNDIRVIGLATPYLRVAVWIYPLLAATACASRVLQAMGHGAPGAVFNFVRVFVVGLPLACFFVSEGRDYVSVAFAVVAGGLAASLIAVPWLEFKLRRL